MGVGVAADVRGGGVCAHQDAHLRRRGVGIGAGGDHAQPQRPGMERIRREGMGVRRGGLRCHGLPGGAVVIARLDRVACLRHVGVLRVGPGQCQGVRRQVVGQIRRLRQRDLRGLVLVVVFVCQPVAVIAAPEIQPVRIYRIVRGHHRQPVCQDVRDLGGVRDRDRLRRISRQGSDQRTRSGHIPLCRVIKSRSRNVARVHAHLHRVRGRVMLRQCDLCDHRRRRYTGIIRLDDPSVYIGFGICRPVGCRLVVQHFFAGFRRIRTVIRINDVARIGVCIFVDLPAVQVQRHAYRSHFATPILRLTRSFSAMRTMSLSSRILEASILTS